MQLGSGLSGSERYQGRSLEERPKNEYYQIAATFETAEYQAQRLIVRGKLKQVWSPIVARIWTSPFNGDWRLTS